MGAGRDGDGEEVRIAQPGTPLASIIVPLLDGARRLDGTLAAMRAQELEGELEILVVDGGSRDGSRAIVERAARDDHRIRLLENPARLTPHALNIGLGAARGEYVARMDAHTQFTRDYVALGIERLRRGDVACASGPQLAVGEGPTSRAVALALRSPLGVGGAGFRRAGREEFEVDSSFCGVWRRDLLLGLGGWDEDWPVNQDAELAARIRARGGRIVCLPQMAARYSPRAGLRDLGRQYRRYGQYRAKTAGRHPGALRRSHVLAPGLVAVAASAVVPLRITRPARGALALYGAVVAAEGLRASRRAGAPGPAFRVPAALAVMHAAWGAGFLEGCRRFGVPWRGLAGLVRRAPANLRRPAPAPGSGLRIGYLVSRFPALSETFVLRELAEVDARAGVRCELFSLFPDGGGPVHPSARPWVARRACATPLGSARAAAYWAARRPLRLAGVIALVAHDYRRHPRLLGRALVAVACALEHARRLRVEPVDHLHAHFATYPALAAWICSRLVGVPYSFTAHAHDLFVHQLGLRRRIEGAAFCVGISEHNARILRTVAPGRSTDVHVVHCAVHPASLPVRLRAPRPGAPMRVVCVAALRTYKGHHVLIDAIARLARAGEDVELDLVGDGPLRSQLERQCAHMGIATRVHFLGGLTEPAVAEVLDRADAFAQASVVQPDGDTDGIPVALMEAMAAGVPVVASRVSGVPELVRDGQTGLLAPPGDVAALADALRTLRAEPEAAIERARAARALVEAQFAVEGQSSRLLALIRASSSPVPAATAPGRVDQPPATASSPADRAERLAREASFHDVEFVEHARTRAWKFYDAGRDAHDRYDELVAAAAQPGASVLEYGCGPGGRALALARAGAHVRGIDISPVAIELASASAEREGMTSSTRFSVMDAEALDLPSASVDLACGTAILHHLDLPRAYRELARVMRPTGKAIFLEPLGHNPVINAYRRLTPRLRTEDEHPLLLGELAAAEAHFGRRTVEHFTLLSIAAVAVHGRPGFGRVAGALRRADQRIFARMPALRRWSWTVVLVLSEPQPG